MSNRNKITTSEFGDSLDLELPGIILEDNGNNSDDIDLIGELQEVLADENEETDKETLTNDLDTLLQEGLNLSDSINEFQEDGEELVHLSYESSKKRIREISNKNRMYDTTISKRSNKIGRLINTAVKQLEDYLMYISDCSVKAMTDKQMEESSKKFKALLKTDKQVLLNKRINFKTFNDLKEQLKIDSTTIELSQKPEIVKQKLLEIVNSSLQKVVTEYVEQETIVDITQTSLAELEDSDTILTPVTELYYNSLNQSQKVLCPNCGEVSHNMIRFTRTINDIKMRTPRPSQLFLHTPLICKCGNVYALTESMCEDLNRCMEVSMTAKSSKAQSNELLIPSIEELAALSFIKIETDIDWKINEELSQSYYKEFMKHNCLDGMRKVLIETFDGKDITTSKERFNLLKDNIMKKYNLTDSSIKKFLYSNGVIKTLVRHQQDIKAFKSKLLFADRIVNSLKVITKEIKLEDDSRELSEVINFLNQAIPTIITGDYVRLTDKNCLSKGKLYLSSILEYLEGMKIKLEKLLNGEKLLKQFYLDNYIELSIPQTEIVSEYRGDEICFNSREELEEFYRCATEGLVYSLWVNFIFQEEINRLQRGNYNIASYYEKADLTTTRRALKTTASYKDTDLNILDNLELFLHCVGSESGVVKYSESKKTKYNFIYKLHEIYNSMDAHDENEFVYEALTSWLIDLDPMYAKIEKLSSNEQDFVDLCILSNLGFSEEDLRNYLHSESVIDCHNIAVRRNNESIEEYLANYDKAPRYIPDYLCLDENEIKLICKLYLDNAWCSWNKSRNYHNIIRGSILEYAINEVNYDTNIFSYCNLSVGSDTVLDQYMLTQELKEGEDIRNILTKELGTSSLLLKNMSNDDKDSIDGNMKYIVDYVSFKEQNWTDMRQRFLCAIKMLYAQDQGEDEEGLNQLVSLTPQPYKDIVIDYCFLLSNWKYNTPMNQEALMLSRDEVLKHFERELEYLTNKIMRTFIPSEKIEFKRLVNNVWGYAIKEA